MKSKKTISSRLAYVMLLSGIATILGFGNQALIAYYFGTTNQLDKYWLVLAIGASMVFYIHPLREALVGQVVRIDGDKKEKKSELLSAGLVIALILMFLSMLVLGAGILFGFTHEGSSSDKSILDGLLYYLFPYIILFGLSELLSAVMLGFDLSIHQASIRLIAVTVGIITLYMLGEVYGLVGLFISNLISLIVTIAGIVATLNKIGYSWNFRGLHVIYNKSFIAMFGGLALSYILVQAYGLSERWIMQSIQSGALSAYQYAVLLVNVLISLLALPLSNILWPKLISKAVDGGRTSILYYLWNAAAPIYYILLVFSVFIWYEASPIVTCVFERGSFDADSHIKTVSALRMTILAAVPISIFTIQLRALISQNRTREVSILGALVPFVGMIDLWVALAIESIEMAQLHWVASNIMGALISWVFLNEGLHLSKQTVIKCVNRFVSIASSTLIPLFAIVYIPIAKNSAFSQIIQLCMLFVVYSCMVFVLGVALRVYTVKSIRSWLLAF